MMDYLMNACLKCLGEFSTYGKHVTDWVDDHFSSKIYNSEMNSINELSICEICDIFQTNESLIYIWTQRLLLSRLPIC